MATDEQQSVRAYLVILERSGLFGCYLDDKAADKTARAVEGVVVAVPVIADYRPKEQKS